MPIMARTSSGIYKTVTNIYDTAGNAISKVYDTQGNVVFKKDNVIHLSFPNKGTTYRTSQSISRTGSKSGSICIPLVNRDTNTPIQFKDIKGKRIIITGQNYYNFNGTNYTASYNTVNSLGTMYASSITTSTSKYTLVSNIFKSMYDKTTYDGIISGTSNDSYYLCIIVDWQYNVSAIGSKITYAYGSSIFDDPQII